MAEVSLDQKYLDRYRSRTRAFVMMPIVVVGVIVAFFLFGKQLDNLMQGGTGKKLIFLAIVAAFFVGAYLLTGLIVPKRNAE